MTKLPTQCRLATAATNGMILLILATLSGCGAPESTVHESSPAPVGSQLPNLAAAPDGSLVLSWVEPWQDGHRLSFAVLDNAGWSEPRPVAHGTSWFVNWADVPSVVPLHDELWAAHWLVKRPGGMYAYDIAMATSRDRGVSWNAPFQPHDDGTPTEHGFVSLWPAYNAAGAPAVGAVWLDGRHMLHDAAATAPQDPRTVIRSAIFDDHGTALGTSQVDDRVCDCCRTAAAITADGPVIAYRDRSTEEVRDIFTAARVHDTWQLEGAVAAEGWVITGCPVNGPALAARDDALAAAWYTEAGGERRVRFAHRTAGSRDWSAPAEVAGGTLGRVDTVWLPDDSAAVSWMAQGADGQADILLARIDRAGRRGAALRVATTEASRPAGFPRLARHGGNLIVAWTRWRDEQPRIVVSRVPVDALPAPD